ncbi:hypothetical protein ABZ612_41865 [Streptomyces avermitilis]|uniref:hypothetical protein n=1 Tax=Streptomyces avermitilis TaxID=33903 RepID=UPI0033D3DF59
MVGNEAISPPSSFGELQLKATPADLRGVLDRLSMDEGWSVLITGAVALGSALIGGIFARQGARSSAKMTAAATVASAETVAATSRMDSRNLKYQAFQTSLDQFRDSLTAHDVVLADLEAADRIVHSNYWKVQAAGLVEVTNIASQIGYACREIRKDVRRGALNSQEDRERAWEGRVLPRRIAMSEAICRLNS